MDEEYLTGEVIEESNQERSKTENSKEPIYLISKLLQLGINGYGPFCGAIVLAEKYLENNSYATIDEIVEAMAKAEKTKNFAAGFVTGLGGVISLPVTIPSSLAANWVIQTRLVAAIAHVKGFNVEEVPVRMSIILSLLGNRGKEILNASGIELIDFLKKDIIFNLPKSSILRFYQSVGSQLITSAGTKGLSKLGKLVPIIGGILSGSVDVYSCTETVNFANELFSTKQN